MMLRKDKWALRGIDGRYDDFVTILGDFFSQYQFLFSGDRSPSILVVKPPGRTFMTFEFFWEALAFRQIRGILKKVSSQWYILAVFILQHFDPFILTQQPSEGCFSHFRVGN